MTPRERALGVQQVPVYDPAVVAAPEGGAARAETPMPSMKSIPFNRPGVAGRELEYVAEAVRSGRLAGDGPFARRCEDLLSSLHDGARVHFVPSCTAALEMTALLLDLGPGDEVIVPSFTFVSTANAFVLRGATPVFADIDRATLCMDPMSVAALISPKTKAIVPVHYGGVACDMDALDALARRSGAAVVEDNAHGLLGSHRGRPLGTLGALATLSFHETKNIHCGEGGALVINDRRFLERAEIMREKGTDRHRHIRGEVDRYTWVGVGSSFAPSELQAAFLLGQLEVHTAIQSRRRALYEAYDRALVDWATANGIARPIVPPGMDSACHIYWLLLPGASARTAFIEHLRRLGVGATFHYVPLHSSPMGLALGVQPEDCPVTEDVAGRIARLPLFDGLERIEQERVIESVLSFTP